MPVVAKAVADWIGVTAVVMTLCYVMRHIVILVVLYCI